MSDSSFYDKNNVLRTGFKMGQNFFCPLSTRYVGIFNILPPNIWNLEGNLAPNGWQIRGQGPPTLFWIGRPWLCPKNFVPHLGLFGWVGLGQEWLSANSALRPANSNSHWELGLNFADYGGQGWPIQICLGALPPDFPIIGRQNCPRISNSWGAKIWKS